MFARWMKKKLLPEADCKLRKAYDWLAVECSKKAEILDISNVREVGIKNVKSNDPDGSFSCSKFYMVKTVIWFTNE